MPGHMMVAQSKKTLMHYLLKEINNGDFGGEKEHPA
jgi:hypothetical protein